MNLSKVWSPYDAKQLGEEVGCPPKQLLPTGEDPLKTSIDSLIFPVVYTPISSVKPQPGSTIQSQGVEAIYSLLSIVDDLAESLVGRDKWQLIYEDEQGKLSANTQVPNKTLPILVPASRITNKELSTGVATFFRQVDAVTNTISRTQLNLQQTTPIDHGVEKETEYKRFATNSGADFLSTFLRSALQTIDSLPWFQAGSSEDPCCVLCISDDQLVYDKSQDIYKLTVRDAAALNSLLIPGDIVSIQGQYYVLSLSPRAHGLFEHVTEQVFTVTPCLIANFNSVYAGASMKLERQMRGSRWRNEPLFKELDTCPTFCCFTQCISMWSAVSLKQDFCVIAAFFKGHPYELGHFPLTALQIVKYLAFYDPKDAVLRFFILDNSCGAPSGIGVKSVTLEKQSEVIRELTDSRSDIDTAGVDGSASSGIEVSTPSSITSDYVLEADLGCCGREADEFFSKYDIDDYEFLKDPGLFPPTCSLNSLELPEVLKSSQDPTDSLSPATSQQTFLSNFHAAIQSISYGVSLMYEVPMAISREYFAWVDVVSESSTELLYLYDRSTTTTITLKRPLLVLNLRKLLSHYLKKNNGKVEEHLNGLSCMPAVQSIYALGLAYNHVLLIMIPYMSGSFFFCSFRKDEVPSSADICIVAQKSVIDVVNIDLLQTHGLIFVSTRTFASDPHSKTKSSTHLHIFTMVYNYKETDQIDFFTRDGTFREIRFTVLFRPVHTLFLMDAGYPAKGIVLLNSMRLAIHFESLSYFYMIDCESLQGHKSRDSNDTSTCCISATPIYTACRSITTLLYAHDGEHIVLFEHGENQALIYSLTNLKELKYSIVLPGGDRINHAAPGGDSGLLALSGDHTISIYQLGASEIFLKHYVTRGRAIGIAWSTPTSLLAATEQALYTITLRAESA